MWLAQIVMKSAFFVAVSYHTATERCLCQDVKAEGVIYLPGFKISPAPEIRTKKL